MPRNSFKILISELLLISFSCSILPAYGMWDQYMEGLTTAPPAPAEFISCPTDHSVTDTELANIIGITVNELIAMKHARSLTNDSICKLPKSRIARSLKKTKDSSKPSINGFLEWRNARLVSGATGTINTVNVNNINTERQAIVVNDGPIVYTGSTSLVQGSGAIDKTRWFSLGPNNVSGRIITMFIDPDYPDTLWAGSAGGGLWKSIDNGNNWSPVADFPGNTAISVIKMDPHDHTIMYIGTGDKDTNGNSIPGNGIYKSLDRGITWTHIASTSIINNSSWGGVSDIYIDPTVSGRFIITSVSRENLISEDDMQTWNPVISGEITLGTHANANPYLSGNLLLQGSDIFDSSYQPIGKPLYISLDYGRTFTEIVAPFVGRTEFTFSKPSILTISGVTVSGEGKQILLRNTSIDGDVSIDTLAVSVAFGYESSISGELCLRPIGSTNSCASYDGYILENTGGIFHFSGSSLANSTITKNGGLSDFEIYFDTHGANISEGITYNIDYIDYESNGKLGREYYINGESYGSGIIYASVNENLGNMYRSTTLGNTWELVSSGASLLGNQGWYGNTIWVNPINPRHLIVGGIILNESLDGGYTWNSLYASEFYEGIYVPLEKGYTIAPHVDYHSILTDPRFPDTGIIRILFGTDGGVYSAEDTKTMRRSGFKFLGNGLNITQFYSIAGTGNIINAGAQDNGCNIFSGVSSLNWLSYGCGDGTDSIVDPHGRYVYGGSQYGWLTRGEVSESRVGMGQLFSSIWTKNGQSTIFQDDGAPFIPSFILDPNNPSRMFFGAKNLWVSDNIDTENPDDVVFRKFGKPDSDEWRDLSIRAIAIAKQDSHRVWISKYDEPFYTLSGATTESGALIDWVNVRTSNLPLYRQITHIEIDYYNPNKVYITYGGYEGSNVWMTENNGVTWVDISANLPKTPIYTIKQFRNNPNFLYVGTEAGLFSSENGGQSWTTTNEGPANTPVFDIEWYNDSTLLIGTFGRGAWALDLNNLTIVPPPTITLSGEILTSMSGTELIYHYKNSVDATIQGNGTLFYTLDNSTPMGTGGSLLPGERMTFSGGQFFAGKTLLSSGASQTIKLRSRDFAGNWSDVSVYNFEYKDTSYIRHVTSDTREPYKAIIQFETPFSLSGSIFYGTSSGNLTTGSGREVKTDGKIIESLSLTGLTANTRYYYQIQVGGTGSLSELTPIASFVTLNTSFSTDTPIIGGSQSGGLSSSGMVYIVGSTATGVSHIDVASGSLDLIDTGSLIRTRIPLNGLTITSSGSWDGTLSAPTQVSTATGIRLSSGSILIDSIYSIGNADASLTLSGQVATISLTIYGANGSTIKIYRSPNILTSFTEIASCIVDNNICTFTTDHFSLFAFSSPIAPILGSSGNGGGGGSMSMGSSSHFASIISSPLQIQYAKDGTTKIPLGIHQIGEIKKNSIDVSKNASLGLLLGTIDYSGETSTFLDIVDKQIITPLIGSIETTAYSRGQKLILYDNAILILMKKLKRSSISSREKVVLILAVQEVTKKKNIFIHSEFSK